MKKYITTVLLLWALLQPMIAVAHDFALNGIYYNINQFNGNEVTVTYRGNYAEYDNWYSGNISIPSTVTYSGKKYSVTEIGTFAFAHCNGVTSISIPSTIKKMGDGAFWCCNGLTKVKISDITAWCNITFVSSSSNPLRYAHHLYLNDSEVKNLTIPDAIYSIKENAFYGCWGLTSIIIPSSVKSINQWAFMECAYLTYLYIGSSVTSIHDWAFNGCTSLDSLIVSNDNPVYDSRNNCNAIIETSSNTLKKGCKSTIIPNSISAIYAKAFSGCTGLTSITIPNSIVSIGNNAFDGCIALDTLNFNSANCADFASTADERPFYNSNISIINIGDNVQSIPSYFATGISKLTNIIIPSSVVSIGKFAFSGCSNLNGSLIIPESVNYIGEKAFYNCLKIDTIKCKSKTPPSWEQIVVFSPDTYNDVPLYVPLGSEITYKEDQSWGQFVTIMGYEVKYDILAEGILLNQQQIYLDVGATSQLIATIIPDSTTNKVVNWKSNALEVASVNSTGLVVAHTAGTATISATTTDGSNLGSSCTVIVTEHLIDNNNYLSLKDIQAFRGDTIVIPITMINSNSIIAFQTDIFLPESLEIIQEDGEYQISPSSRMTRTHSIMGEKISNGAIRVISYSSNYKPFTGNSGDDLFYITVKVADDASGEYTIQLKNTLLTNTDFVEKAAPDVTANMYVNAYLLGDVNGSGTVTVTDVVATALSVLEKDPHPFIFEAADLNQDGIITVTDVTRIAHLLLFPSLSKSSQFLVLRENSDQLCGKEINLSSGQIQTFCITLNNYMDYSAFQFNLCLPEGLTASNFQLTDRASSHVFDVNTLQNGNIRALCYSPTMTVITGHEGALVTFDVTAAGDVNGDITIDGIELVTADCQSVKLDAFTIEVNNASSVNESITGKAIAKVEYFNVAGQRMEEPSTGVTLIVTTYTDGSRTTSKVFN